MLLLNVSIGVQIMSSFKSVVDKLKGLETERRNLLLEIEELKKMADSKAKALENEVSMLREEVKSLRVLLGAGEPELQPEPKRKK
jgi:predicted  nucleic acid-binding Zn-ribbon protein